MRIMVKPIFIFLVFFFVEKVNSQPLIKLWLQIDTLELENSKISTYDGEYKGVQDLDEKIIDFNVRLNNVLSKKDNDFLKRLINLRILKITSNLELIKNLKSTKISNTTFQQLNSLISLTRGTFSSQEKALKEFQKSDPGKPILALFGMTQITSDLFQSQVWNKYCSGLNMFIKEKESRYYDVFTPNKSRFELWNFINKSVYPDNKYYNHKALEAFKSLFLYYTNDGEPLSISTFSNYIYKRTNNTVPWDDLVKDSTFISLKDSLSIKFRKWEQVLLDSTASKSDFLDVIKDGASREVGFLALQRLIKIDLSKRNYNAAIATIRQYQPLFKTKEFWSETESKVNALYEILNSTTNFWEVTPIEEFMTPENEISYFLNTDNSSIVINYDNRANTKQFDINKRDNSILSKKVNFSTYTTPDFLWFEKSNGS